MRMPVFQLNGLFIFNVQNSMIVFIAEEICSWLSPWLAEKMEILSVYARVPVLAFMLVS